MTTRSAGLAAALLLAALPAAAQNASQPGSPQNPATQPRPRTQVHARPTSLPRMERQRPPAGLNLTFLTCSYSWSDVTRSYIVTNQHTAAIPTGTTIYAESTSEDPPGKVSLTLDKPLGAGQQTGLVFPDQTNGGQCRAWFSPGPADLQVVSVELVWLQSPGGATTNRAKVKIANKNPFRAAPATTTRVELTPCPPMFSPGYPTSLGQVLIPTGPIPPGGLIELDQAVTLPEGARALRATADVTNVVAEPSEENNMLQGSDGCSPMV